MVIACEKHARHELGVAVSFPCTRDMILWTPLCGAQGTISYTCEAWTDAMSTSFDVEGADVVEPEKESLDDLDVK